MATSFQRGNWVYVMHLQNPKDSKQPNPFLKYKTKPIKNEAFVIVHWPWRGTGSLVKHSKIIQPPGGRSGPHLPKLLSMFLCNLSLKTKQDFKSWNWHRYMGNQSGSNRNLWSSVFPSNDSTHICIQAEVSWERCTESDIISEDS